MCTPKVPTETRAIPNVGQHLRDRHKRQLVWRHEQRRHRPARCTTASGCGVIFEMTPNQDATWTYHVLQRFASYPTDGQSPAGGLLMDKSGNSYGTTLVFLDFRRKRDFV
jgi:hypothetical protein